MKLFSPVRPHCKGGESRGERKIVTTDAEAAWTGNEIPGDYRCARTGKSMCTQSITSPSPPPTKRDEIHVLTSLPTPTRPRKGFDF